MIWIFVVITVLVYFYFKVRKAQSYWRERGVVEYKCTFLLGQSPVFKNDSFPIMHQRLYSEIPNERYVGGYNFLEPTLYIRDLELIKQITVKAFDHFQDHRTFVDPEVDKFWSGNLITTRGEKWRQMRNTLSPSFTASKMKIMFKLMDDCAQQFIKYHKDTVGPNETIEMELRDSISRYTNDVIASAAFGIECDSLKEKNNEFYLAGKEASNFTGTRVLRIFAYMLSPTISTFLKISVIPRPLREYFTGIIANTVRVRKAQNIYRPDMIQLLMGAQDNQQAASEITADEIAAHAFLFFIAGFDTGSVFLNFTFYELALNQAVQERLRAEIQKVDRISYESLLGMKYLDMVTQEVLRKWPPSSFAERICTKDFLIEPERPHEKPLLVKEGIDCLISIIGLHRDPEYFPEPEKFDPERFNEEHVKNIPTGAYIPFGYGPRICIGNRFALMEVKLMIYHILKEFRVVPIEKTQIPVILEPRVTTFKAKGGLWLGFEQL